MAIDLNDKTANGNNLTNSNGAEVAGLFAASSTAVDFERSTPSYLQVSSDTTTLTPDDTDKVTIEAKIKIETLPSSGQAYQIFANWYDTTNYYMLRLDNEAGTHKLNLYVSNGTTFDKFSYNHSFSEGTAYWVSGAWQGSDKAWEITVDGSSVATGTGTNVAAFAAAVGVQPAIGSNNVSPTPSDDFFDGVIDEVRVWNTKRTATEINNNRDIELVGNESGLIGYWPFESIATTTSTSTSSSTTTTSTSSSTSTSTTTTSTSTSSSTSTTTTSTSTSTTSSTSTTTTSTSSSTSSSTTTTSTSTSTSTTSSTSTTTTSTSTSSSTSSSITTTSTSTTTTSTSTTTSSSTSTTSTSSSTSSSTSVTTTSTSTSTSTTITSSSTSTSITTSTTQTFPFHLEVDSVSNEMEVIY